MRRQHLDVVAQVETLYTESERDTQRYYAGAMADLKASVWLTCAQPFKRAADNSSSAMARPLKAFAEDSVAAHARALREQADSAAALRSRVGVQARPIEEHRTPIIKISKISPKDARAEITKKVCRKSIFCPEINCRCPTLFVHTGWRRSCRGCERSLRRRSKRGSKLWSQS